jgi:hypothetical protein
MTLEELAALIEEGRRLRRATTAADLSAFFDERDAKKVAEAVAAERARILRSAPSERLPSGSPISDRERAAFNEGRAAVLRIVDGAEP